ncbi:MAG: DUF1080 domain-containing protein [Verrucomicrobiaceae bacterium]|nr:DUF1080 domain-containing protein [Verrucomicrobiaceae bacterium]
MNLTQSKMKYFLTLASLTLYNLLFAQAAEQGKPQGYTLETVDLPKGAVTILGLCHKPDGTLAVATWEGEVWERKDGNWSLFAENLMEPNGIYYDAEEDAYYVAQKPELTRLVDEDKDGKCDRYDCVTDAFGYKGDYHEYHFGPVADSQGRLYATLNLAAVSHGNFFLDDNKGPKGGGNMYHSAPYRGWIYRSDKDGHFHPLASGIRSPAGLGISPDDEIFVTDNQGDWLADCAMYHIEEGNFYGHPVSLLDKPEYTKEKLKSMTAADFDKLRTPPAIWFPRVVISNSPGSPVWDQTGGKFGPFEGQIFLTDQTQSNYFRAGTEEVNGVMQGWCIDFIRGTESGGVKLSWAPDGTLWSAQVGRGWMSKGGKRTALQYAKWDGKTMPFEIHHATLTDTGFQVSFTEPIGKGIVPQVRSWHYNYWSHYGSPRIHEQEMLLTGYTVAEDRKSIRFDVPLQEGKVYALDLRDQRNAEGELLGNKTLYYTLNKTRTPQAPVVHLLETNGFQMNKQWQVKDGVLGPSETPGGIIYSTEPYEDFSLTLEYKTSKECNSGVFFRTDPKNPVQDGMEIQIASPGLYRGKHVVGALFDAKEPVSQNSKPDGEWNTFHLTCIGSRLIATINGRKVQTADLNAWVTPNQNPDGSKNKFNRALKDFSRNGHIGLQYHGQDISFRNITMQRLK